MVVGPDLREQVGLAGLGSTAVIHVEADRLSFVSAEFPIFMAAVFTLYYLSPSIGVQNLVILVASYVFYGF